MTLGIGIAAVAAVAALHTLRVSLSVTIDEILSGPTTPNGEFVGAIYDRLFPLLGLGLLGIPWCIFGGLLATYLRDHHVILLSVTSLVLTLIYMGRLALV